MSHREDANLISAGDVAEAFALNADDLVVGALVGGDGVDSGGGAGGHGVGEADGGVVDLGTLRGGHALLGCSGDTARTWRRHLNPLVRWKLIFGSNLVL